MTLNRRRATTPSPPREERARPKGRRASPGGWLPRGRRWVAVVAAPLRGPRGRVGTVFGYQGRPSWIVATVRPGAVDQDRLDVQALTRDGRYLALGKAVLGGGNRAWAACAHAAQAASGQYSPPPVPPPPW